MIMMLFAAAAAFALWWSLRPVRHPKGNYPLPVWMNHRWVMPVRRFFFPHLHRRDDDHS